MNEGLTFEVVRADQLTPECLAEIHALCRRAYHEDVAPFFRTFTAATHILGWLDATLVSQALWVTRWLQPGDQPPLRTAYVEMVATEPQFQQRGFATAMMRRLAEAISDFELGGLSPADTTLYTQQGWAFWQGPLFIRSGDSLIPTPKARVMILSLPKTPPLDLVLPLSAEWREGELW